jgi:prepilin-type N-terminal cleavage/methylation domain-containing protein
MAAPKRTRGFTLVELLVVITIIGMLVSLLLPAIQSAREAGRRNTCQSNMRNAGIALTQFENSKKYFPGYANVLTVTAGNMPQFRRVSWVVPILPYLERNDLYQNWQSPAYTNGQLIAALVNTSNPLAPMQQQFVSQLNILLCPSMSNPSLGSNPLSFVVNTGMASTASDTNLVSMATKIPSSGTYWPEDVNSGVFFNHCNWDGNASMPSGNNPGNPAGISVGSKKTNIDFVSTNDGTTYTLMMSENLQAFSWATDPTDQTGSTLFLNDTSVRQSTGMLWFITNLINNNGPPTATVMSATFSVNTMGINDGAKALASLPALSTFGYNAASSVLQVTGLEYARPSSNHPGGVNSMFVGGNMRFITEDIPYNVYTQLMTPNQMAVNLTPPPLFTMPSTPRTQAWTYTLNEADF